MLADLLTPELIRVHAHATSWKDAVLQTGELLERAGKCDHSYVEAMVASVERFGPYIVLEDGVAMPHAQSDGNVHEQGICVLTLDEPVDFGNEDFDMPYVLIGICAPDPKAHLGALSELARMFDVDDAIPKLGACESAEEILSTLRGFFS